MVQAILDGRKTQTRRVIKPQPELLQFGDGTWVWKGEQDRFPQIRECPYGQPGDRLWVRETWGNSPFRNSDKPSDIKPNDPESRIVYKADPFINESHYWWRPSIHMPRWMSRITLEVVSVRVERVQHISEADAAAEGVDLSCGLSAKNDYPNFKRTYHQLWNSINEKRGYSWESNPWVWVIEFKRV